jgi:hypothetical protein
VRNRCSDTGVTNGVRRIALLALIVAAALAATVEPSRAKLPPWTCEHAIARPVVGHQVGVVVHFWWIPPPGRPIHTRPERFWRIPSIPRLLEAQAEGSGAAGHRTLAEAIRFARALLRPAASTFP